VLCLCGAGRAPPPPPPPRRLPRPLYAPFNHSNDEDSSFKIEIRIHSRRPRVSRPLSPSRPRPRARPRATGGSSLRLAPRRVPHSSARATSARSTPSPKNVDANARDFVRAFIDTHRASTRGVERRSRWAETRWSSPPRESFRFSVRANDARARGRRDATTRATRARETGSRGDARRERDGRRRSIAKRSLNFKVDYRRRGRARRACDRRGDEGRRETDDESMNAMFRETQSNLESSARLNWC
jgi:hypothetical protein